MYRELSIIEHTLNDEEAMKKLFLAVDNNLNGICASSYFLPRFKELIPEGMVLASPVNYPNGMGDFQLTQHSIISAQRKGANAIDLVLNPYHITNRKIDYIIEEMACYLRICKEQNTTLRIMLEYRSFNSQDILGVTGILVDFGVEYIFPSTGHFVDDLEDNLMICQLLKKKYPSLNVISTGQVWRKEQYDQVVESGVFGLRLYNGTSIF